MRDVTKWLSLAALSVSVSLTGCVSQSQYKKAVAERDQLKGEVETARAEAEDYKNQLGAITDASNSKDEQITSLSSQNSELQAQLEEINRQYAEALERANTPLPAELNQELSSFAAQNPDFVEFDQEHGIVKFRSDVTFAPGAVELTPKAREVVARLSKVLNDQGVSGYELMIAGHTDSMPVERASTIKAGHLDNWYLSAHRAISVGKCLQKNHVSAGRMAMVGYADQHPVASNITADGRAKNRRVELLILPHKAEAASADWLKYDKSVARAQSQQHQERHEASAQTDEGPAYNK